MSPKRIFKISQVENEWSAREVAQKFARQGPLNGLKAWHQNKESNYEKQGQSSFGDVLWTNVSNWSYN